MTNDKKCGACNLCCLMTCIPELGKEIDDVCPQSSEYGCLDYENRPEACASFRCVWLKENLPEQLRPDLAHIMIERLPGCSTYVALVEPGHNKAWLQPEISEFFDKVIEEGSAVIVNVAYGKQRFFKGPEGVSQKEVMADLRKAFEAL